jgi:hypothetical protein
MDGKKWYLSKTVWVGTVEIVIAVLLLLAGDQLIAENPKVVAVIGTIVGILTIVLRKLTNQPLKA